MDHDLQQVVWVQSVEHVEKIVPGWALAFRVLAREVAQEVGVLGEHGIKIFDSELVVVGDLHCADLDLFEELFFARVHLLQEVFVHHRLVGQIKLKAGNG